jgi:nucleoside-diphosphate-sugar epimerase
MRVLVTGANGFVGSALISALVKKTGITVIAATRKSQIKFPKDVVASFIDSIEESQDWTAALDKVEVVIHCAARVHVIKNQSEDEIGEFHRINVLGTINLARQAARARVKRFIFLSSVKVNGELTQFGAIFFADQIPHPKDPYGISKMDAENALRLLGIETSMEMVIVRPPLVYGPGVKANFLSMMNWLQKGIPLPLGGVTKNRRSFVFLGNLVDMLITCINHPAAANQTFLVSDGEDLSTAELLARMALALGRPSKLIPLPAALVILGAKLVGRVGVAHRLCGSLQVDIEKTKNMLGWLPPVSLDEGLSQTAAYFLEKQS